MSIIDTLNVKNQDLVTAKPGGNNTDAMKSNKSEQEFSKYLDSAAEPAEKSEIKADESVVSSDKQPKKDSELSSTVLDGKEMPIQKNMMSTSSIEINLANVLETISLEEEGVSFFDVLQNDYQEIPNARGENANNDLSNLQEANSDINIKKVSVQQVDLPVTTVAQKLDKKLDGNVLFDIEESEDSEIMQIGAEFDDGPNGKETVLEDGDSIESNIVPINHQEIKHKNNLVEVSFEEIEVVFEIDEGSDEIALRRKFEEFEDIEERFPDLSMLTPVEMASIVDRVSNDNFRIREVKLDASDDLEMELMSEDSLEVRDDLPLNNMLPLLNNEIKNVEIEVVASDAGLSSVSKAEISAPKSNDPQSSNQENAQNFNQAQDDLKQNVTRGADDVLIDKIEVAGRFEEVAGVKPEETGAIKAEAQPVKTLDSMVQKKLDAEFAVRDQKLTDILQKNFSIAAVQRPNNLSFTVNDADIGMMQITFDYVDKENVKIEIAVDKFLTLDDLNKSQFKIKEILESQGFGADNSELNFSLMNQQKKDDNSKDGNYPNQSANKVMDEEESIIAKSTASIWLGGNQEINIFV